MFQRMLLVGMMLIVVTACSTQMQGAAQQSKKGPSDAEITALLASANEHYYYVLSGGNLAGKIEETAYNGTPYRYLGDDLSTLAKVQKYLEETFTPETANQILTELKIVEIASRAAQPNADGGSLLDWNRAKLDVISANETSIIYHATVPLGDTGESVEEEVTIQHLDGAGWRVSMGVK
ncbi:IseA DL-endopeptidase inhibitor family protein [Bacillus tianshenii]|nr:IseA DL-endopeptidase inhibitor family protein [Bacillus tianshenii]